MITDLNLLYLFYCVGRQKNITKAAEELYISQPAASQSLKVLESQIGLQLIYRKSKGIELTSEGKTIHNLCKNIFRDVEILNQTINDLKSLDEGILRIGASDTICKYYLIDKLKSFESLYPNIRYRVTNCTTNESLELLKDGKVDLSFIHSPINNKNVNLNNCLTLHDCFVCAYDFDDSNIYSLSDLMNYRILLLETDSYSRRVLDENLKKYGITLKPKFELASLDLLIEFCKKNMGIICVSKEYIKKEIENKELKIIEIPEKLDNRYISLATFENSYLSYPALRFIEHVK